MDFVHRALRGHLNETVWNLFIKNRCSATLKFIEPISKGSHRRRVVLTKNVVQKMLLSNGIQIFQINFLISEPSDFLETLSTYVSPRAGYKCDSGDWCKFEFHVLHHENPT